MNDEPFNLVICRAGPGAHDHGLGLLDRLRAVIRRSRYGVLVSTGCLLAADRCRQDTAHDAGTCMVVQPCRRDRRPRGMPIAVGPILTCSDVDAVTAWLQDGPLDASLLESRLRLASGPATPAGLYRRPDSRPPGLGTGPAPQPGR